MKKLSLVLFGAILCFTSCKKDDEPVRIPTEEQLVIDLEILDTYLADNNITASIEPDSKLRYVITQDGIGLNATDGQIVSVNYSGYILEGAYFDTSIESIARANNLFSESRTYVPISFTLGVGNVIRGWDIGIALLNRGAKATFYIPSTLAYGTNQQGDIIVPNSILIFDVELVDIN